MVLSPGGNFCNPYCLNNTADYISYYTTTSWRPAQILPEAGLITGNEGQRKPIQTSTQGTGAKPAAVPVAQLCWHATQIIPHSSSMYRRGMRLLLPDKPDQVCQTLARLSPVLIAWMAFMKPEVAVRLVLVSTETAVVFHKVGLLTLFNGNNNANTLIGEVEQWLQNAIGSANFDIGHTFAYGGGGLAYLGCVCNNTNKARALQAARALLVTHMILIMWRTKWAISLEANTHLTPSQAPVTETGQPTRRWAGSEYHNYGLCREFVETLIISAATARAPGSCNRLRSNLWILQVVSKTMRIQQCYRQSSAGGRPTHRLRDTIWHTFLSYRCSATDLMVTTHLLTGRNGYWYFGRKLECRCKTVFVYSYATILTTLLFSESFSSCGRKLY